jgi:hypothetical protein
MPKSKEEIRKRLTEEWDRLKALADNTDGMGDEDYFLWRLLRNVDGESAEEEGLLLLILRMSNE